VEYWKELNKKSHEEPQIVFKHSSACPISLGAFESLKKAEEAGAAPQEIHMLVVQASPELSATVEEESKVKHESPQLLILRDGEVAFHANHYEITGDVLTEKLQELTD
jgi:bacillithiol system protein YtxJ